MNLQIPIQGIFFSSFEKHSLHCILEGKRPPRRGCFLKFFGVICLTYHNSSAFGIHSQELSWNNASTATLAKGLLVHLFKHVLGGVILQDYNTTRITAYHDVVYNISREEKAHQQSKSWYILASKVESTKGKKSIKYLNTQQMCTSR